MSSEDLNNMKRRRVARACDTCRRKKVRCDGVQAGSDPPSCTNCKAYGYECSFIDAPKKRGPPKGYIEALETRLQRMESILGGLVQSGDLPEGTISSNLEWINVNETNFTGKNQQSKNGSSRKSSNPDDDSSKDEPIYTPRSNSLLSAHRTDGYARKSKDRKIGYYSNSNSDSSDESLSSDSKEGFGDNYDLNDSMGQLAIDETGQTRYLGNSSGIFLLRVTNRVANGQIFKFPRNGCEVYRKPNKPTSFELPPRELCDEMLDVYFKQVHPFIPIIDPEELRKKYRSISNNSSILILLFAMFAMSKRFSDPPLVRRNPDDPVYAADLFFESARDLLKEEFDEGQLSTVQALLLMSAYQQGAKNSRSWMYTGMAIRMAQDMGLHRDSAKWSLEQTNGEVRKRVWWSCYISDRFVSAGLGRPMIIDDSDCDVPLPTPGLLPGDEMEVVDCWVRAIKLVQILGRVLMHIYGIKSKHTTHAATDSVLAGLDRELNSWREALPPDSQYDPGKSFSDLKNQRYGLLHLTFYTTQILLHRPHIRGPKSKAPPSSIPSLTICTMAANNITHITYRSMKEGQLKVFWNFILHFFFTASIMHVINALSGDDRFREVAKHGLRMSLKCLEYLKKYWFSSEKCIMVIRDLLCVRNISLDGFNPNGTEHFDRTRGEDANFAKVDGNIVSFLPDSSEFDPAPNSQHVVKFAPSPTSTISTSSTIQTTTRANEYSTALMQQMAAAAAAATVVNSQNETNNHTIPNTSLIYQQQHHNLHYQTSQTRRTTAPIAPSQRSPSIPYENSPSPASSSSSISSFIPFGNEFPNQENAFFPPNADAFSADIALTFDDEDPLGNGNPFWDIPSNFNWNEWTDYVNGMQGLRFASNGNGLNSARADSIASSNVVPRMHGNGTEPRIP
ncbi:hypothetical protein G9A89_001270 [Geosiphon pyriformis]|nr:hypothetical protein G9A89_001270 [Geosiphon pyriformis]